MADERRREARFDVESGHGTMLSTSPVEILNMSLGGLAFRTETRLAIGEEYTVTLDVAGRTVKVRGIVAWSVLGGLETRNGETVPVYSVGMKFQSALNDAQDGLLQPVDGPPVAIEQRLAGVRFHLDGQAHIDHPLRYTVRVISNHGMLIEIDHPMKVDDVLPLEVSLDDEAPDPLPGPRGVLPRAAAAASQALRRRLRVQGNAGRGPCAPGPHREGAFRKALKRDIAALAAREHDLLVVGGGITGAAAAWDAALRGLRVALVEAADFGGATSWNSLKTIHGGLRHLQRADVASVLESARERAVFLRIAPALVRPLPFLVPTHGHGLRGREALGLRARSPTTSSPGAATAACPRRTASRAAGSSPRDEVRARVPGLDAAGLTGGALWTDAQVDGNERLVLAFVRGAAEHGAAVANHAAVEALLRDGGRARGRGALPRPRRSARPSRSARA